MDVNNVMAVTKTKNAKSWVCFFENQCIIEWAKRLHGKKYRSKSKIIDINSQSKECPICKIVFDFHVKNAPGRVRASSLDKWPMQEWWKPETLVKLNTTYCFPEMKEH